MVTQATTLTGNSCSQMLPPASVVGGKEISAKLPLLVLLLFAGCVLQIALLPFHRDGDESSREGVHTPKVPQVALDGLASSHEIGSLKVGDVVSLEIPIVNSTDFPFEISSIQSSCGCVSTKIEHKLVLPGESVPLHAVVRATQTLGSLDRFIWINGAFRADDDEIKLSRIEMRLHGTVEPTTVVKRQP